MGLKSGIRKKSFPGSRVKKTPDPGEGGCWWGALYREGGFIFVVYWDSTGIKRKMIDTGGGKNRF
jgi:hypothetical protein